MKRIVVIGSSGAGKTTLAKQLGLLLSLPVVHLDKLFWEPGWILKPEEELSRIQKQLVQQEMWILDGSYESTLDIRLVNSDFIIFLDIHPLICIYRLIKRYLRYARRSRPDMNPGCPEGISFKHLKCIWHYPKNERLQLLQMLHQHVHEPKIVILRRPKQVKQFLHELSVYSPVRSQREVLDQMTSLGYSTFII